MRYSKKVLILFIVLITVSFVIKNKQYAIQTFLQNHQPQFIQFGQLNTISVSRLKQQLVKKNFTLINVHTPYDGELMYSDMFIPYDKIIENSSSLPKDKNTPIILYCKSGRMSQIALDTVRKLGYTDVLHLLGGMDEWQKKGNTIVDLSGISEDVIPKNGIELPIHWGAIGPTLIKSGVIDISKFRKVVTLSPQQERVLTTGSNENITVTRDNSQFVVDLLWALGLTQKSIVYEEGPLGTEYKKDIGNFASTGGWTLARGDALRYLNKQDIIPLTDKQQRAIANIAKNIYRPCCGNSTWFPDCNHGMAALGAIELMVAADLNEATIYKGMLALNSYWFSDSYTKVATHFARRGTAWKNINAKLVLSEMYSSSRGAAEIAKNIGPLPYTQEQSAPGCGA